MTSTTTPPARNTFTDTTGTEAQYTHTRCPIEHLTKKIGTEPNLTYNVLSDAFCTDFKSSQWKLTAVEPTSDSPYGKLVFDHPEFTPQECIIVTSNTGAGTPTFDVQSVTGRTSDTHSMRKSFQDALMSAGEAATVKRKTETEPVTPGISALRVLLGSDASDYTTGTLTDFETHSNIEQYKLITALSSNGINIPADADADAQSPWEAVALLPDSDSDTAIMMLSHDSFWWSVRIAITVNNDASPTEFHTQSIHRNAIRFTDTAKSLVTTAQHANKHGKTLTELCRREHNSKPLTLAELTA